MKNAQSLMSYADYGMFPLCCWSLAVVRWRIPRVLGNRRNVLRSLSAVRWGPKHRPMIIRKSLLLADRKFVHESRFARNAFCPTGLCSDRRLFFFQYPVMKFRESCCRRHPDLIFSQIQDYYRSFPRKWALSLVSESSPPHGFQSIRISHGAHHGDGQEWLLWFSIVWNCGTATPAGIVRADTT